MKPDHYYTEAQTRAARLTDAAVAMALDMFTALLESPVREHPAPKFSDRVFTHITCIENPDPFMGKLTQPSTTILNRQGFQAADPWVLDAALYSVRSALARAGIPAMPPAAFKPGASLFGYTCASDGRILSIGVTATAVDMQKLEAAFKLDPIQITMMATAGLYEAARLQSGRYPQKHDARPVADQSTGKKLRNLKYVQKFSAN